MNNSQKNIIKLSKNYKTLIEMSRILDIKLDTLKGIIYKNSIPRIETLIKISEKLNISLDTLVFKEL